MNEIKISLDNKRYTSKPVSGEAARINKRIGKSVEILDSPDKVCSFIKEVAQNGCTFSPATFSNGSKKIENFEQMQMLVLDFDGSISYEAVRDRADKYQLPLLAAYDTFSSQNHDRFRVIFLNDTSINDKKAAKIYKSALMQIFPESDKSDTDISKMYYGGKELLYLDKSLPVIDMESTLRNMTYYLKEKHGATHYKSYIRKFARQHGIRLNKKKLLDISVADSVTESPGTSMDGKNSQKPIWYYVKKKYKLNVDFFTGSTEFYSTGFYNHVFQIIQFCQHLFTNLSYPSNDVFQQIP